jgi:D-alanyl-D-alanine carboxypeptidase (penicillin-binding protein 5/6)
MTAYVAMKRLPLTRRVRVPAYSAIPGESLLGLRQGQRVSVRDLLYGLILRSGNDAAFALAVAAAGSERRFVRRMNERAAALGLADTSFANPIGLDEPGNLSSARDLVALTRRLYRRSAFRGIADAREAVLGSLRPPRQIVSRNTLLFREPWATGVKTGHTLGAGYVLVASGRRGGVELISAVLGAGSEVGRDLETLELLDYGFSLYRQRRPVQPGDRLATVAIDPVGGELALRAARGVKVGVRRGQDLTVAVRAPEEVEGPIPRGQRLGSAIVSVDGRRAAVIPLRAARAVPEASSMDRVRGFAGDHAALIVLAGSAILLGAIALWRRRRPRSGEDEAAMEEQAADERQRRRDERQRRRGGDGGAR